MPQQNCSAIGTKARLERISCEGTIILECGDWSPHSKSDSLIVN